MPVGKIDSSLIGGPGASYSYGGWRGNKAWKKTVAQFVKDKSGNWVQNNAYYRPMLQGAVDSRAFGLGGGKWGRGRITWSTGWRGQSKLDQTKLIDRVNKNSGWLDAQNQENRIFNQGEDARKMQRESTQSEYDAGIKQLAAQRVNERQQLMTRAGRLGLGFSQGRVNALANINNRYDQQGKSMFNNYTEAINQLVQQGKTATDDRDYALRNAWNQATVNEVDALRRAVEFSGKPNFQIGKLNSRYQYLDPKTGEAYRFTTRKDKTGREPITELRQNPGTTTFQWWDKSARGGKGGYVRQTVATGKRPTVNGWKWDGPNGLAAMRNGTSYVATAPSVREVTTGYKTIYAPSKSWRQPWRGGQRGWRRNA